MPYGGERKRQVRREFGAFQEALTEARTALDQQYKLTLQDLEQQSRAALEQKEAELRRARDTLETTKTQIAKQRSTSLQEIDERGREALSQLKRQRDNAAAQTEREYRERQSALENQHRQDQAQVQARYDQEMAACENEYRTSRLALEERWDKGLTCIQAMLRDTAIWQRGRWQAGTICWLNPGRPRRHRPPWYGSETAGWTCGCWQTPCGLGPRRQGAYHAPVHPRIKAVRGRVPKRDVSRLGSRTHPTLCPPCWNSRSGVRCCSSRRGKDGSRPSRPCGR